MGYSRQALSGFTGQSVLRVVSYGLAVAKLFILTRLLSPDQFGLFSLTMIALGVSEAALETGINFTILQAKQSIKYFIDTAWVIAIIRGLFISAVMILLALGLSKYFQQPQLLFLITWVSLVPIIKGFINPAVITMQKELRFKADTLYRVSFLVVETLSVIGLVFVFRSIYAWLAGIIVAAVFEVIVSFLFVKPTPRFGYLPSAAKTILGNAKNFSIQAVLSYLTENVDNLLIGKINGVFALGLYQPTYSLSHAINFDLAKSAHHGALPVYTKIIDDKIRLRRAFVKAALATSTLALVTSLPFLVMPKVVIDLLFGSDWAGATALLPWLVAAGWIQALVMICVSVLQAKNKISQINIHLGVSFIFMIVFMTVLGQRFGVQGAVIGLVLSRVISLPVIGWFVRQELKIA